MPLPHYTNIRKYRYKPKPQLIKESRINKLRKLEGLPLIDFGPDKYLLNFNELWEPIYKNIIKE